MEPWVWTIIWAVAIAGFLVVEFVTVQLVSIWFAAGSIGGLILSCIPGVDPWIQILVSVVLSFILLLLTRKIVKKWIKTKKTDTNLDVLVGKEAELLTPITKLEKGTVKINGVIWNVIAETPVNSGQFVRILSIDGNKLLVEPAKPKNI